MNNLRTRLQSRDYDSDESNDGFIRPEIKNTSRLENVTPIQQVECKNKFGILKQHQQKDMEVEEIQRTSNNSMNNNKKNWIPPITQ